MRFYTRDDLSVVDDSHLDFIGPPGEPPSADVNASVRIAEGGAWNNTLQVITNTQSVHYNFTGFSRVAVYGAVLQNRSGSFSAVGNYTLDGNSTALSVPQYEFVVTYPLFQSERLDPTVEHTLSIVVAASPDSPYLLDYILTYGDNSPSPTSTSGSSSTSTSTTTFTDVVAVSSSSPRSTLKPFVRPVIGVLAGLVMLLLFIVIILAYTLRNLKRKWARHHLSTSQSNNTMTDSSFNGSPIVHPQVPYSIPEVSSSPMSAVAPFPTTDHRVVHDLRAPLLSTGQCLLPPNNTATGKQYCGPNTYMGEL